MPTYKELRAYLDRFAKSGLKWVCDDEDAFSIGEMKFLIKNGGENHIEWNKVLRQHYDQRNVEIDNTIIEEVYK